MTKAQIGLQETQQPEWFASWFDSAHYHRLYTHRDHAEAARFVDALVDRLRPANGAKALDLGCGGGRHARQLASHGMNVTGLDLSEASIRTARAFEHRGLRFARHDMRRPFGNEAFDCVFNLFTSFGYFDDPAEHLAVVGNMARSLKAGGRLVLDYLNVEYAEAHEIPHETVVRDDSTYDISRWNDAGHFFKRIVVNDGHSAGPLQHVERVAKFSRHDFELMFALYGMAVEDVYGDYQLSPFDHGTSPRLILIARSSR
jgi:SAM-dependent methyltransferase